MRFQPSTKPTEYEEFSDYAQVLTGEMVSAILVLGAVSVALFWPIDLLLHPLGSPMIAAYATMRAGLLLIIGLAFAALNTSDTLKQLSSVVLGVAIAIAAYWVSSSIGPAVNPSHPPDNRWAYSIYLMPFITLVLVTPLVKRCILTVGFTQVVLIMLAAPNPDLLLVDFAGTPLAFLGFACIMSIGVGHVLFRLARSAHGQQSDLVRRETFLTKVNHRLEDDLARQALDLTQRIRDFDAVPQAIEEDRKRLARDIHDELGQLLSALRIRLAIAQQHVESPKAIDTFGELDELLQLALGAVNGIVGDLRTPSAKTVDLKTSLSQLTQRFEQLTETQCTLGVSIGDLQLDDEQHKHIYRIVQEALTNILRHARATQVQVLVTSETEGLRIAIRDNGLGFDAEAARAKGRHGLLSLEERAEILGANLSIRSGMDAGTTVSLRLPSAEEAELIKSKP
jgi:signal transduction histidine kinase